MPDSHDPASPSWSAGSGGSFPRVEVPEQCYFSTVAEYPLVRPPGRGRQSRGPDGHPAGERDDGAAIGVHVAQLLFFHGELTDGPDQGGNVSTELGEFPVLAVDRLLQAGDGGAEPGLVLVACAFSLMRW